MLRHRRAVEDASIGKLSPVTLLMGLGGVLLAVPASVSAATFEPTRFVEGRSLERYILFPGTKGDVSLTIRCQSYVTTTGDLGTGSCYLFQDDGEEIYSYIRAINTGISRAKMTPARVDGGREEVLLHFTVLFERKNDIENITVKLNHGGNAVLYGDNYLDPQLYWRPATAVRACISLINISWAVSVVDTSGRVLRNIIAPASMSAACRGSLEKYLSGSRYIPAFSEGKPVDAYFGNPLFRP